MSSKRKADKCKADKKDHEKDRTEEKRKFERSSSKNPFRSRTLKKAQRKKALKKKYINGESTFTSFPSASTASHSSSLKYFKFQPFSSGKTTSLPLFPSTKPIFLTNNPFMINQASKKGNADKMDSSSPSSTQMSLYNIHVSTLNKSISSRIDEKTGERLKRRQGFIELRDVQLPDKKGESMTQDPACDLTSIFVDYKERINDILEKYGERAKQPETIKNKTTFCQKTITTPENVQATIPPLKIKPSPEDLGILSSPQTPLGSGFTSNTIPSPVTGFSSVSSKPQGIFEGFQFNSSMATSSLAVAPSAARGLGAEGKDDSSEPLPKLDWNKKQSTRENKIPLVQGKDEYVPPQEENIVVQEKDSLYTAKCKLFYLKDGAYVDKGVGHLHLKPIASSSKTQLLIRADNPLGPPLLNISLSPAMPVKKQGRNNIGFSCVSNPPVDEKEPNKVIPMLIRVKTSDEADELLNLLEQRRNQTDQFAVDLQAPKSCQS